MSFQNYRKAILKEVTQYIMKQWKALATSDLTDPYFLTNPSGWGFLMENLANPSFGCQS